jgi:hypothetical protein
VDVITSGREDHLMADTPSKTSSKTTDAKPAPSSTSADTADVVTEPVPGAVLADRTPDPISYSTVAPDLAAEIPMRDGRVVPTPGDPRTEPVATAAQSWVPGRVGPATIEEDATSLQATDAPEVQPGAVLADTPEGVGRIPVDVREEDPIGEALNRVVERVEAQAAAQETVRQAPGTVRA